MIEKEKTFSLRCNQQGCGWAQGSDYREEECGNSTGILLSREGRIKEGMEGESRGAEGRTGEGRGGAGRIQACESRLHLGGCHMALSGKGRICPPL